MLRHAERESRIRQRDLLKKNGMLMMDPQVTEGESVGVRPLILTHIQGPLFILIAGMFLGIASFLVEYVVDLFF